MGLVRPLRHSRGLSGDTWRATMPGPRRHGPLRRAAVSVVRHVVHLATRTWARVAGISATRPAAIRRTCRGGSGDGGSVSAPRSHPAWRDHQHQQERFECFVRCARCSHHQWARKDAGYGGTAGIWVEPHLGGDAQDCAQGCCCGASAIAGAAMGVDAGDCIGGFRFRPADPTYGLRWRVYCAAPVAHAMARCAAPLNPASGMALVSCKSS